MKYGLNTIIKYIQRFKFIDGLTIYIKNHGFKKGMSVISLKQLEAPFYLRRSTSDVETFMQVFLDLEYQYALDINPEFIVDCGANIGLSVLYFKNKYPQAFIVAVEPEASNYDVLKKNTEYYSGIDCIKSGIWNKSALLEVVDEHHMGNWGFVCKETDSMSENTIPAISIDEIMRKYGRGKIDILKIDIEGSELELFSSNYEMWLPHTKVIMIELHDWLRKGCSKSFFAALMKYDFSVFLNGENLICVKN